MQQQLQNQGQDQQGNDNDIWDEESPENFQKELAHREMQLLENHLTTMGFREGRIDQSDEIEKINYLNGVNDAYDEYSIVGYAKGKSFLIKTLMKKFESNLSQDIQEEIREKLKKLDDEQICKQQNEGEIDQYSDHLLQKILGISD